MKMKNMVLAIMACFLIFISMSCICACDDVDMANTRDASDIIVDDAIDDSINVIDDGASSAADDIDDSGSSAYDDGASSAADDIDDSGSSAYDDGASSAADDIDDSGSSDSIDIDGGDSIIRKMTNDIPKYNTEPISNIQERRNSFDTLQNLINNVPAESTLFLYDDYIKQDDEYPLSINKDMTIFGNGHSLNADGKGRICQINFVSVVLNDLILTNGACVEKYEKGGAIYVQSAVGITCIELTCNNVQFIQNCAKSFGAAVHLDIQTLATFTNCIFKGNKLVGGSYSHDGGAIYSNGTLFIKNCLFDSNKPAIDNEGNGGAIYAGKDLSVVDSTFNMNKAHSGGAIYAVGYCDIRNSYFSDNQLINYDELGFGGAIYCEGRSFIESCTFSKNFANDRGGAIYSLEPLTVNGVNEFIVNEAHDFGGAIYSKEDVYINWDDTGKTTFKSNKASSDSGGAIYSEKRVYVRNGMFDSNFAEDDGGAIFSKGDVYVNWNGNGETIFKYNKANTDDGGSIYSKGNVYVKNSDFSYGYAHDGGAIFAEGNTIIDSSVFNVNYASHQGGAIYNKNKLTLYGCTSLAANEAHDFGGAIYSIGEVHVYWDDNNKSIFKYNRANSDSGGAIYCEKSVYVINGEFYSNFAEDDGGAIFSKGNVYINWNFNGVSSFKSNRANTDDGGAIYSKGNVCVKYADFSDGYAHDGGAIFAEGNTIIDSSSFTDNYASHQGGAIYEKAGIALRELTYFTGNGAKDSGGAIYTRKFDEDVYHATFKNNRAGDDGGAIYIDHENHETFTECDFEGNYAGDEGGAIYLDDGDSHLSLIRNNLVNNNAKSGYTVYNHGNYDDIKDNWHGSSSPNFDNQFKKYRLILKDKVITPSSYAKTRISW